MIISTIGLDLAKSVFQVHAADPKGKPVICKKLRRDAVRHFFANMPPCLVAMEACASAHYWGREISRFGHDVRLIPPKYVKPFVKRQKNDRADAEAICEAAQRPNMRFVSVKTEAQQGLLILHRARELLMRQRTQLINALRGHLAEFGVIAPQGVQNVQVLTMLLADVTQEQVPTIVQQTLQTAIVAQLRETDKRIGELDTAILAEARSNEVCTRLMGVPGIGAITATAIVASVGDPKCFRSGRHFASWLGLVPKQYSSGGKERLGGISKAGDGYIRRLLVHGARSAVRLPRNRSSWFSALFERRPMNVAVVALANKMARVAWALMSRGETYSPRTIVTA